MQGAFLPSSLPPFLPAFGLPAGKLCIAHILSRMSSAAASSPLLTHPAVPYRACCANPQLL